MTRNLSSLEDLLSYRLSLIARLINRRSTRYLWEQYGLTLAEWRCLSMVAMLERTTVREIAERTSCDKAQVSRATAGLTSKGLISRERNENDGRSGIYAMTPEGQQRYKEIMPLRAAENEQVLKALTPIEQSQMMDYMDRIQASINPDQANPERPD